MQLFNGDCLDILPTLPDNSVDLILTDPPYFKVKNLDWDKQWAKPNDFLEWLDIVLGEFHRVMKPNGSLYLFASPQMSWAVEGRIREKFCVLNNIRWVKAAGWHQKQVKEEARQYIPNNESIIFAEHHNSDNIAKGEAGYLAKCDELRGFVFEPLRKYLDDARRQARVSTKQVNLSFSKYTNKKGCLDRSVCEHYWQLSQWCLPTKDIYENVLIPAIGADLLNRSHEELRTEYEELRTEYEELRTEYEELRRPFNVTSEVPYTDVWTYETVKTYKGKHPCEKPAKMATDIINASSREGGVVLDAFMGSGVFGQAAVNMGREFIGIEQDPKHFDSADRRINQQLIL